jgi:hypothetical protein
MSGARNNFHLFEFVATTKLRDEYWISTEYQEIFDRGIGSDSIEEAQGYPFLADLIDGEVRMLPARNGVKPEDEKKPLLDKFGKEFKVFLQTKAALGGVTGGVHPDLADSVGWKDRVQEGRLVGGGIFKGKTYKILNFRGNSLNVNYQSISYASELIEKIESEYKGTPVKEGLSSHADRLYRMMPGVVSAKIKNFFITKLKKSSDQENDGIQFDLSENTLEEK